MNRVSEEELKRITEEKGFEYVGVNYTTGKTHNTNIAFICPKHREKGIQSKLLADMRKSNGQCNYCNGKRIVKRRTLIEDLEVDDLKIDVGKHVC